MIAAYMITLTKIKFVFLVLLLLISNQTFSQGGAIDQSFNVGVGFNDDVYSSVIQSDGKILVGGYFTSFNTIQANRIIRLNTDGTVDNTFDVGTGFNQYVKKVHLQPNGKVLVLGDSFSSFNGIPCNKLVRLNTDGSMDLSFIVDSIIAANVDYAAVQTDNKIVLSGYFNLNGLPARSIIRLNEDSSIDTSFNVDSLIYSSDAGFITIQPNGKIIVACEDPSTMLNDKLIRLNIDGSTDPGFNSSTFTSTNDIYISDISYNAVTDKVIVSGNQFANPGSEYNVLIQLNNDGSIDTNFAAGMAGSGVNSMAIQSDGKIIALGTFQHYQGEYVNGIVRLNLDGSIDSTFYTGVGFGTIPFCAEIQSDGKIVVGTRHLGTYNGTDIHSIVRLSNCSTASTHYVHTCDTNYVLNGENFTYSGMFLQVLSNATGCDSVVTLFLNMEPFLVNQLTNAFALPDEDSLCTGQVDLEIFGNAPFELKIDSDSSFVVPNTTTQIDNLCSGIHDLMVVGNCGDTLMTQFVIPTLTNYIFNEDEFTGSEMLDSISSIMTNCNLNYNQIDTAYIDSIWANGNIIFVIWNMIDSSNGSNLDTATYMLNYGNGAYLLQLSVYCPNKNSGDFFTVTQPVYYENGHATTAGLNEPKQTIELKLIPNPTTEYISFYFEESYLELSISDTQGKLMDHKKLLSGDKISLAKYENGVYFFHCTSGNNGVTKRVVKL
jgi:uncharacterized delta-60 repeat protein